MTVFNMPEGVEVGIKIYLVGYIEGVESEAVLTVDGMPSFTDSVTDAVEVAQLVAKYAPPGAADWRVMTRAEIADYKARNR